MAAAVNERTRMAVVTNPNNPTGTIVTHDALARFVAELPERVIVLVDEAYADLAEDGACADGAGLAPGIRERPGGPHLFQGVRPGGIPLRLWRGSASGDEARPRVSRRIAQRHGHDRGHRRPR